MNKTLALNEKERERLVVLRQVKEGKLRQRAAAEQLQMSVRWVKKLLQRMRQQGDRGLVHRLRGRSSNRGHTAALRRRALDLLRERYSDYGPTLASEVLEREHGLRLNRETLRQWMSAEGLWRPRRVKLKRVHVWRPRRRRRGELVQWDTSEHDWLEGRGPKLYLIGMLDDASSELLARFVASDSTAENMRLLQRYIEQRGRPVAVYTDKSSLFQVNRPLHYNKHLEAGRRPTQIERALKELGIERITAHSPQAKGRIERCFGTLQDRLVKGLRQAGASCLREANRYLEQEFLPSWNQRFRHPPAEEADVHRPLQQQHQLASILSHVEQRVVGNDYTICWRGRRYQIPARQAQPRLRKAAVRVEQRLDGTLWLRWGQHEMRCELCRQPQTAPASPLRPPLKSASQTLTRRKPSRKNRWMDGFQLRNPAPRRPPLAATPVALRAPSVAAKANRTHAE